jgi:glutaminase
MDDDDFAQELVEACARGNLAMAKKLVKAGANVARGDYDQRTPLHLAAAEGRVALCRWLVGEGALVTARDNFDRTPFEDATLNQQQETCDYLQTVRHGRPPPHRLVSLMNH